MYNNFLKKKVYKNNRYIQTMTQQDMNEKLGEILGIAAF